MINAIIRQDHFDENNLDPMDNIKEDFGLLSEEEIEYLRKEVDDVYENTDRGVYLTFPGAGFGDVPPLRRFRRRAGRGRLRAVPARLAVDGRRHRKPAFDDDEPRRLASDDQATFAAGVRRR